MTTCCDQNNKTLYHDRHFQINPLDTGKCNANACDPINDNSNDEISFLRFSKNSEPLDSKFPRKIFLDAKVMFIINQHLPQHYIIYCVNRLERVNVCTFIKC